MESGVMIMKKRSPTGRNVPSKAQKASPAPTTDGHERAKDFLNDSESHGLRVSEVTALRRDDANLGQARLWVRRLKNGLSVEHPIPGDELRFIRRYLATRADRLPWLFLSERGQPLSRKTVYYLVPIAAQSAGLQNVHPHTC